MITGAIFDMDGVLLDSMPVWDQAGKWYLELQGRTPEPELTRVLFTKSMMEAAEYIRVTYSIPKTMEEIMEGIIEIIRRHYETDIPAKPGVLSFLKKLKEKNIPVTVATSSDRVLVQAGLGRLGILEYVDGIFTCCEVGIGKDHPDVFLKALESMGTKIEETWVFEDSLHAILTAKKAGFPVIGLYDEASDKNQDKIKKEADIYLGDLTDFAKFYSLIENRE